MQAEERENPQQQAVHQFPRGVQRGVAIPVVAIGVRIVFGEAGRGPLMALAARFGAPVIEPEGNIDVKTSPKGLPSRPDARMVDSR